jgi:choice-of-anchor A domain-containing protein/uncharacterized repeat protein (TIGR01451 family)
MKFITNALRFLVIFIIISLMISPSFASIKEGQNKSSANAGRVISFKKSVDGTSVAKIYGVDKTVSIKFVNPTDKKKYITTSAGTFSADVDGTSANFYCVDLFHYLKLYTPSEPNTYTDQSKVGIESQYILNNYYPYKSFPYDGGASSVQVEAAAVQVALWYYSDGLDYTTVDNVNVRTRAKEIIEDANTNSSSYYSVSTLVITPENQTIKIGLKGSFIVSAFDENGNPLNGIVVSLSASNGTLSATSVTTGTNGSTPAVTITQGGDVKSVITATAGLKLNPGVKFVHSSEPDNWQKIVLATVCGSTQTVTANVEWYSPSTCDTKGFITFTQGGWGSPSNSTPGKIRDTYFTSVFPSGLVVGGTYKLTLTSAIAVKNCLPDGGTAAAYTHNYSNSTSKISVLSGQLVALKLNVQFSAAGYLGSNTTRLGNLQIAAGTFAGKTVSEFLALAEAAIGGGSLNGYTLAQYNEAATSINENFDNGTADNGFLTCPLVNVEASIGDKVWLDADKDGIQDSGETGVSNVTVKLYDCKNNLISTTTTNSSGNYLFDKLNPGDYYVEFTLPSGYIFTTKNSGSDSNIDSDADVSSGKTICTTLAAGENDLTWDAGIYAQECKNKIGDFVWHDLNVNGIQDSGEPGIKSVVVELIQGGSVIASTTTDDNGKYEFANLANGTYSVKISSVNFAAGGVLANTNQVKWYASSKNIGGDDAKDSDAGKNESVSVTLNCANNITIDFGFYKTCISVIKTANKTTAQTGDKITYTFTVENCGDIQHHGGIDVFDKLLNATSPYKIKHIDLLNTGESTTFTFDYTVKNSDCGDLINEVMVEGHPVDGSAYDTAKATAKVFVDCNTPCTTGWTTDLTGDHSECEYGPVELTVNGNITLTPNPSEGYLVTSWKVTYPNDGSVDNSTKITTTAITGSTSFEIKVQWPGIRATDESVEVEYSVQVLDCNKNPLGTAVTHKFYWNADVCTPPPSKKADLKIEKSSSSANPQCGDDITYTVKVTNLGPADATAIQVTDVLPDGLSYKSYSATQGTFDVTTGNWTVGNLANGAYASLSISVNVDCELINNSVFDLGIAKEFNLFVIQDLVQPSSDTEGKIAVGRDATLGNYSVGDKLPENNGDVLVVGRNLVYTSGRVYNGNVVYGDTTNLPIGSTSIDGTLRKDSPINFTSAKTYLENLSNTLSTYASNGTTELYFHQIKFAGNDPHLNVFYVKGSDLANATSDSIVVPSGAAVLINIDGNDFTWSGGLEVVGTAINNVLYNFYNATELKITNIDVRGSILAPFAVIDFASGVQNGQMIAKSITGQGQFNNALFYGNIPTLKQITNIALISGTLTEDDDATNNSASVKITVNNSNTTPNTGNEGSGATSGTWEEAGSFSTGEIIYSLCYDNNGNTYAGTMGGKISKSSNNGTTWVRINSNMNVTWIWSLVFFNNTIYAATELGLYKYDGSAWTLTNLKEVDVRSLCYFGNTLYAGTWGDGVYKSEDNGTTWTAFNTGLENFDAISALTADASGNIFAGTMGGGIFKLFNGESNWYHYDLENNLISTLASTPTAIFASVYGGGLYRSLDKGSNWEKTTLDQQFIYSTIVDKNNKVLVSTWTSGVHTSTDDGATWTALGMVGFNVNTLIANPNQSEVLAGTTDGKIYKIKFSVTDVDGENSLPTNYELSQNYPNPFNPTTTINYAMPERSRVKIEIFNILGQKVTTLLDREETAGKHNIVWNSKNDHGAMVSSGVYIIKMAAGSFVHVKKMMLLK